MRLKRSIKRVFSRVLSFTLAVAVVIPLGTMELVKSMQDAGGSLSEIVSGISFDLSAFGNNWQAGVSNPTGTSGFTNMAGGIADSLYPDTGFAFVISRDPDLKFFTSESGMDPYTNLWQSSNYSYATDTSSSLFLLAAAGNAKYNNSNYSASIAWHLGGSKIGMTPMGNNASWRTSDSFSFNPRPNGVFYDALMTYYLNSSDGMSRLKDDLDGMITHSGNAYMSLEAWSYITSPSSASNNVVRYDIEDRFQEVFNHNNLDFGNFEKMEGDEAIKLQAQVLDVLLTLACASNDGTSAKDQFKKAILDYIDGADLKENPISVKVQPLTCLIEGTSKLYFMRTLDFIMWYGAFNTNYRLGTDTWKSFVKGEGISFRGNSMAMMREALRRSLIEIPYETRISSIYWKEGGPNGAVKHASYGMSRWYLTSTGGNARWATRDSETARQHDTLVFYDMNTNTPTQNEYTVTEVSNAMWGLMIIPLPNPGSAISASLGKIIALPDNKQIEGDTIGENVTIQLYAGITEEEEKNNWKTIISNVESLGGTFTIEVELARVRSNPSSYGTLTLPTFRISGVSPDKMRRIIDGEMIGTSIDNVSSYSVPDISGGTYNIQFDYKADFTVTTNVDDREYTGTSEDPASFVKLPPKYGYVSEPEAYVELKNYSDSSNMSGYLDEDWEAMAGIPSTEQLYFAAGGSEFILDVTVEYVEDEVAKRTYTAKFTGNNCEFMDGDNSKTHTLGGVTVDTHTGGHYTASGYPKTGNHSHTQNPTSCGTCGASGYNACTVDTSAYDAALAEAIAYAQEINGTVLTYTDASHNQTRTKSGWGANVPTTSDTSSNARGPSGGSGCLHGGCSNSSPEHQCSGGPCSPGSPCTNSHAWCITVEFSVPSHVLCGPCCEHRLPAITDTWAQTWTYDTTKIVDVHVWQLDQAATEGLEEIIGPGVAPGGVVSTSLDEGLVGADIRQGRPSIFFNIAAKNDANYAKQDGLGGATGSSNAGRVRYSLDPTQHDIVTYELGQRTNNCDGLSNTHSNTASPQIHGGGHSNPNADGFIYNSFMGASSITGAASCGQTQYPTNIEEYLQDHTDDRDKATIEYSKILQKRDQLISAYMITDFLILQTSSGDQCVLYYHQQNPNGTVSAEDEIPELQVDFEKMWEDNPGSAADWEPDHINIGGYNGKYLYPNSKFDNTNNGNAVTTLFDGSDPAGKIRRPARPSGKLMLYNGRINIILEDTNKFYSTGKSEVFWANLLHWTDASSIRFSGGPIPADSTIPSNHRVGPLTDYDFYTRCTISNAGNSHATPSTDLTTSRFNKRYGYIMEVGYSDKHDKINDIIIHDPVSTEYVALVSLPDERDQRYGTVIGAEQSNALINSTAVCPGTPGLCDYRILNCKYGQDILVADFDFSTVDDSGLPINKVTENGMVLPSGFSLATRLTGTALKSDGGIRVSIPLTEFGIDYSPSTKLQANFDFMLDSLKSMQMLASFQKYGLYVNSSGRIGFTTGNGDYRYASNITIRTNTKYSVQAVFSFSSIGACDLYVNGVKANFSTTGSAAPALDASYITPGFNIGSYGTSSAYGFRGYIDNLKITKLAGSTSHDSSCYVAVMNHPNGLNYHQHSVACLNDSNIENIMREYSVGSISNSQLENMLGPTLYDKVIDLLSGELIHTWSSWSSSNMQGFSALNQCSLSTSGGKLVVNSTGSDPYFGVPVNFSASGVGKISVTLDNNTSSTSAQLYWTTTSYSSYSSTRSITVPIKAYTSNQTIEFNVNKSSNWTGTVNNLRFDLGTTSGTYYVRSISVYGFGTKTSSGTSSGASYSFGYTGGVQSKYLTAGSYKLEVWGAQGGSLLSTSYSDVPANTVPSYSAVSNAGKLGGYAAGTITLSSADTLYIYVGGMGGSQVDDIDEYNGLNYNGGYNGGGSGAGQSGPGGGGATHISTSSGQVLPSNQSSNKTSISGLLLIAGGGGGGYKGTGTYGNGSYMNGMNGATGWHNSYEYDTGGSGAGYRGGSQVSGDDEKYGYSGSSYVSTSLSDRSTSNNSRSGNGYAKITALFSPVTITSSSGGSGVQVNSTFNFGYNGTSQSKTLPAGVYKLEVWGAQGGQYIGAPGLGGYAAGTITLTSETTLRVYVGGSGSGTSGGWNGGGQGNGTGAGGGGATDIRVGGTSLYDRIIVAGGGGGSQAKYGGAGGGSSGVMCTVSFGTNAGAGTQSGGYSFGYGGPALRGTDNYYGGAGGGGWYGGYGSKTDASQVDDKGGSGGSGYVYTASSYKPSGYNPGSQYYLTNTSLIAGNTSMPNPSGGTMTGRSGNGYARITTLSVGIISDSILDEIVQLIKNSYNSIPYWYGNITNYNNRIWSCGYSPLNVHKCDSSCYESYVLDCTEPHHQNMHYDGSSEICWDACNNPANHKPFKNQITIPETSVNFRAGNFINLDWGFEIYFPNIGNFYEGQPHGLAQVTEVRGLGFVNSLNTSKWTRVKRVQFSVNVIRNGVLYTAGQWITLADRGEYLGEPGDEYDPTEWSNYGTELYEAIEGDLINGVRNGKYRFYCVEANEEIAASTVKVEVEAVNCPGYNDNSERATNKDRFSSLKSLHGGTNEFYMDVVGRIGNLVLEDTGDYRFSNLFKKPIEDVPEQSPIAYTVSNNGLTEYGNATTVSNTINASRPGDGAYVPGLDLEAGQYKIVVNGQSLNNGKIKITTQSGWKVLDEYDETNGINVAETVNPPGTNSNGVYVPYETFDYRVTGPGIELEPGKYRLEIMGQGFLDTDWKIRVYNPNTNVYKDLTSQCEHVGSTDKKVSLIIDLPSGIPLSSSSTGLEIYCESENNPGFIFDRFVVKKLETSSSRDIADTDAVSHVTISSTIMSYYVNIADDTPVDIHYLATNSNGIKVNSITVQKLGNYDDTWIVEGIIKKVDQSKQNKYFAWGVNDIRGVEVSADTRWLNTYGTQNWMVNAPLDLPLSPGMNEPAIMRDEPMLVGYDLYLDISTIGSYFENDKSRLQVIPYYYVINLDEPNVSPIPVDAYLKYAKGYYPVNIFGLPTGMNKTASGASQEYKNMTMDDIYNFTANLDWVNESTRRNYTAVERYQTEWLSDNLKEEVVSPNGLNVTIRNLFMPSGTTYNMGNSQFIQINGKARTFIGGETTSGLTDIELGVSGENYSLMNRGGSNTVYEDPNNGRLYNPQGLIPDNYWWRYAQRWHFTIGLPSSTVFVRRGVEPDSDTIQEFQAANYVILLCADIRAIGGTWQLRYSHTSESTYGQTNGEYGPGSNGSIKVTSRDGATVTYPIPLELPPAIAVYSSVKSSEFDVSIIGVH